MRERKTQSFSGQNAVHSLANAVRPHINALRPRADVVRAHEKRSANRPKKVVRRAPALHQPCTYPALTVHLEGIKQSLNPLIDAEL